MKALSIVWLVTGSQLLADDRPNVIVIVADDLGYGDVGFNGPCDIPTPNLDALAHSGIVLEAGYATHPYCSPSRAGLLTGRYQQRFGHECNPALQEGHFEPGLPVDETLIADVMRDNGYRTVAIGKWHLGDSRTFWPTERGFDEWFGFTGGGLSYWGTPKKGRPLSGVMNNGKQVAPETLTYLTDDFSHAAVGFVKRNRDKPFFMYLAYNAPHAPDHATRKHLEKVRHIEYGGRAVYGAMVAGMDDGIGKLMQTLDELQLKKNTLVFFYSDNGGRIQHASNLPLRGHKGMLFEGGIRVPFCISWPKKLAARQRISEPVSALDIYPTILAACEIDSDATDRLDGLNLLPSLIQQDLNSLSRRPLFWRYSMSDGEYGYAVREGDHKLVMSQYKRKDLLFDLRNDLGERHNLASKYPDRVQRLKKLIQSWDAENTQPMWPDAHGVNVQKEEAERSRVIKQSLPPTAKQ
ncbi:N-acetylgalactosamine 6-sulfate sulfatase (GALNS) [Rhodopirellula maiorica SM1]|uniref:N-acetylgalactosamine 6-sulfate sulfatase (GALNS) n=1 Tax=Rhodopirellula maiorica SM1 TaxID=1265738 RepID=M5RNR7_9BACT|nr:sulfatase-like hydrolase/transferase [Rhodopirellula maiorica]EMI17032.1 N-acetylgalactosamine 6-sulfate sulfatase (GALNS) [Rhodopirellula maiorica SM1]